MKNALVPVLLLCSLFLIQCDRLNNNGCGDMSDEWLVFGNYYCECGGDCAKVYRLENEQLFKRTDASTCMMDDLTTDSTPLSGEKYNIAKVLMAEFPEQLWSDSKETYGCPDCGDWGGYRLIYHKNGETRTWQIDIYDTDLPDWLKPYQQQIKTVFEELQ